MLLSLLTISAAGLRAPSAAAQTIGITASDPDGVNTGTARLGIPVSLTASVGGTSSYSVQWILQGRGTLQASGSNNRNAVYTPPLARTSNETTTVVARLVANHRILTSYRMSVVNPVPVISPHSGVAPDQLVTGATQPVNIYGAGFTGGTVAILNGTALSTSFESYNHVIAWVPVADNDKGKLNLQMFNPAPAGGWGTKFAITIEPNTIALTARSSTGVNTGSAVMGTTINMSAAVSGSTDTAVSWSVAGAGHITTNGIYTAPSSRSDTPEKIIAVLVSNPAISAIYDVNILNPVPSILSASPFLMPAGGTTTATISGGGFVPGTTILVNGVPVPTTYESSTSVSAQITVPPGGSGTLNLSASNPAPGGGVSDQFTGATASAISVASATRLLDQTTFGPTTSLIQHVGQEGINAWLIEQFKTPQTTFAPIPLNLPSYCGDAANCLESEWWRDALTGNDQLRQRVAFALSQLFVVSTDTVNGQAMQNYSNMLARDAFSNWSTIVHDVTLSSTMGVYLNMIYNVAAPSGQIANENYARENLQLFNIGTYLLNDDGTPQLDSRGNTIPAYTEAQVQAFARAYTGWVFAAPDGSIPNVNAYTPANYNHPMVPIEHWHDHSAKILLNGAVLSANQNAQHDLADALTNIFNHQNTPPFVSKQLIQHLVTSNPSPGYVARVAAVFKDNGSGVRGDMIAVLTTIFTDPEARAGDTQPLATGGHLTEPVLWLTSVMRALGFVSIDPNNFYDRLSNFSETLSERPFQSPSVFNFFSPQYVIQGTGINAPEFGIENTASVTDRLSLADMLVHNYLTSFNVDLSATSPLGQLAVHPESLVDRLGILFMHGQMDPNVRSLIINEVKSTSDQAQRVRLAAYLVITASQYKIQN